MKRYMFLIISILLISTLILIGCGKKDNSPLSYDTNEDDLSPNNTDKTPVKLTEFGGGPWLAGLGVGEWPYEATASELVIFFTFNSQMNPNKLGFKLTHRATNQEVATTQNWDIGVQSTVYISPSADLTPNCTYIVELIAAETEDVAGNMLDTDNDNIGGEAPDDNLIVMFTTLQEGDEFTDIDKDGRWDSGTIYNDINTNGEYDIGTDVILWDNDGEGGEGGTQHGDGTYDGVYNEVEPFVIDRDGDGEWDPAEELTVDHNNDGNWDNAEWYSDLNGDDAWTDAEQYTDSNGNGEWDDEEAYQDLNGNDSWDSNEPYTDSDGSDTWDAAEAFVDTDNDSIWDDAEPLSDENDNGVWDDEDEYIDSNSNDSWDDADIFNDNIANGIFDKNAEPLTSDLDGDGVYDESNPGHQLFWDIDDLPPVKTRNPYYLFSVDGNFIEVGTIWTDVDLAFDLADQTYDAQGNVIHTAVQSETVNNSTILLRETDTHQEISCTVTYDNIATSPTFKRVHIAPSIPNLKPNKEYEIVALGGEIKDAMGNKLDSYNQNDAYFHIGTFTTADRASDGSNIGEDGTPPMVIAITNNTTYFTVIFSELIDHNTISLETVRLDPREDANLQFGTTDEYDGDGDGIRDLVTTVSFHPLDEGVTANIGYFIVISAEIKDLAGNRKGVDTIMIW